MSLILNENTLSLEYHFFVFPGTLGFLFNEATPASWMPARRNGAWMRLFAVAGKDILTGKF